MKKTLFFLLASAYGVSAADHARIVTTSSQTIEAVPASYIINGQTYQLAPAAPQPVPAAVAPVAPVAQAAVASSNTLELAGVARFAINKIDSDEQGEKINVGGVDLTYVHHFTPEYGLFVRLGYSYGSKSFSTYYFNGDYENDTVEVETSSLMIGFRYSEQVSDSISIFGSIGVGIAREEVSLAGYGVLGGYFVSGSMSGDDIGAACSVELGVKFSVTDRCSIFAAYEFSGSSAKPEAYGLEAKEQFYNGVRFGLGVNF